MIYATLDSINCVVIQSAKIQSREMGDVAEISRNLIFLTILLKVIFGNNIIIGALT